MRIALLIAVLFSFVERSGAQKNDDTLKEIHVRDKKNPSQDERLNNFSVGQKLTTIDSVTLEQYRMQSVANLLSQQTPVFIKSYGLNGLATLNIRGSSAAQSQVFWNGVPINNAALGMADISLLPVSMINKLHLIYGSSAALWGSGNIGGALLLESDAPSFQKKFQYEFALGAGSFGQYQAGGKIGFAKRKFNFSTNVFAQTARNNFKYENDLGETERTSNAHLNGLALQQQIAYRHNEKSTLRFIGWYQNYYREIPAAMFEAYSEKIRRDESLRLMLDWNRKSLLGNLYAKAAFLKDKMHFVDDTIKLNSENTSYQSFVEAGWKKRFSERHQLMVFTPLQISWMKPDTILRNQQKYALVVAYSYNDLKEKFKASVNLRDEVIDGLNVFLPGISASYAFTKSFTIRANFQRTFRVPTLNELYYSPGGNKNLKPEKGWSIDAGYKLEKRISNFSLLHDVSVYNRVIEDWIIWLGGAIWTPHNIASVHSRGIETENLFSLALHDWKLYLGFNASYIAATTMSSHIPNDGSIGKQIPYTPKYSGQLNAGFGFRSLYFNYNHTYTGLRYMNVDETGAINAYQTSNVQASYLLKLRTHSLSFSAQANNIFNASYQVVNARPMPGVNWLFSLRFSSR
ncbi:MAG TPA: TonB-dependent receptor [Flavipsychrobacter sp.]|nr:TonB-dependent receptor [Flavipsychrobacter sp.]